MNDLEDKVLNATALGLCLSLETSHAILTEAWEKFHEARVELNDIAATEVEPEYAHNRARRIGWAVDALKSASDAIYALTPMPEEDVDPDA